MDLRCPSRLHGVIDEDNDIVEVKCHSKSCGAGSGATVLHYFSLSSGECVRTRKFREPQTLFEQGEEEVKCR